MSNFQLMHHWIGLSRRWSNWGLFVYEKATTLLCNGKTQMGQQRL